MIRSVLVVEDEPEIARLVERHLKDLCCCVELAFDGEVGLAKAKTGTFDLIILDLMLPGVDGLEICRQVRGQARYTPILMLTAKGGEFDRVLGLDMGANDYLSKPFSFPELLARVRAIFRSTDAAAAAKQSTMEHITAGDLTIDARRREVTRDGQLCELTSKEFDLLMHFAQHPGVAFSRAQLLDLVWGSRYQGYEHSVNCHINRLRAKIEVDHAHPRHILTVWGVGYKFAENERV